MTKVTRNGLVKKGFFWTAQRFAAATMKKTLIQTDREGHDLLSCPQAAQNEPAL